MRNNKYLGHLGFKMLSKHARLHWAHNFSGYQLFCIVPQLVVYILRHNKFSSSVSSVKKGLNLFSPLSRVSRQLKLIILFLSHARFLFPKPFHALSWCTKYEKVIITIIKSATFTIALRNSRLQTYLVSSFHFI